MIVMRQIDGRMTSEFVVDESAFAIESGDGDAGRNRARLRLFDPFPRPPDAGMGRTGHLLHERDGIRAAMTILEFAGSHHLKLGNTHHESHRSLILTFGSCTSPVAGLSQARYNGFSPTG